jgi:hypothetical protein
MALLGLAATDVSARGTEAQVETAPAFLAALGLRLRQRIGNVLA